MNKSSNNDMEQATIMQQRRSTVEQKSKNNSIEVNFED
jgi:hypothetical protein